MSKRKWITNLKLMVKRSPLYSNCIIGFVMLGLEQLVEIDFACPCNPKLNLVFSAAYFVVPALFSFALLFYIQSSQCKYSSCLHCAAVCLTPALLWIMLLFFDGQYFACAKTSWEGLTVHTDISASTTWCKPLNKSDNITEKQMAFFSYRNNSQIVGLCILLLISLPLIWMGIKRWHYTSTRTKEPDDEQLEMEDFGNSPTPPPDSPSFIVDQDSSK
ncbi:calcium homeostasis modulator protein 4-like [Xyrauchen texanus]|uniref:calcium homeostasis modulator protein 4-like n=1 Tax=Xyrauchen texanus TaxID=154827 RepID=UPI0022429E02|nr:calcium homeostasis modulator protein 4-like [Xyrauchen texanus]